MKAVMKSIVAFLTIMVIFVTSAIASNKYNILNLEDGSVCITNSDVDDSTTLLEIPNELNNCVVSQIDVGAIGWGRELSRVSFPDSITYIAGNPFNSSAAENIESILISPNHPYLAIIDGSLFSKPDKRMLFHLNPNDYRTFGKNRKVAYSVPDGIEIIGESAFEYDDITKIVLPNTVKQIDKNAFHYCRFLTSAILSSSLQVIDMYAFEECDKLSEIVLPDGLKSIGAGAFSGCKEIKNIELPESIEYLGSGFISDTGIKSVSVPKNVALIDGPIGIVNVTVSPDNANYYVSDGYLIELKEMKIIQTTINKSSYTIPSGIKTIGGWSFYYSNPESVTLPDTVETIEYGAFIGCDSLESVYLPDSIKVIDENVFGSNTSVKLIVEPNSYAEQYAIDNKFNYAYPDSSNDWLK